MKKINVGSDFSGVGAFDQALMLLGIPYNTIFSCDMDKYARETYIANYGEPPYYPKDVYDREIPTEPLDVYMTSPPCQGFSMSGARGGSILFHNSHEFIKKNNPRFFIFENVKGLLSHDRDSKDSKEIGKTFQTWINYLGGKSVNGNPVLFPMEEAVHYHIYWTVLNTKHFGIPQNRERIFIIGIRDDEDNSFRWPQGVPLLRKLKDILEDDVDEKYFISDKLLKNIIWYNKTKGEIANVNKGRQSGQVFSNNSDYVSTLSASDYKMPKCVQIKSATSKGYEEAQKGDSINFSVPNSKTRRGRVGKGVAQTLDTACNQAVIVGAIRGRGEGNKQQLELKSDGITNTITSVQKDNVVVTSRIRRLTPLECFRLQGFPDSLEKNAREVGVSSSQLYKQAGNSITIQVLAAIINKLNLKPWTEK